MPDRPVERDVVQGFALLVNSCDAYADCWTPFFTLLANYWQSPIPPIYLNTETQGFAFPGLEIHCPRVELEAGRDLAWSDRLMRCLDRIPHDIVVYLQEDFFINDEVSVAIINELVAAMERDRITYIDLMHSERTRHPSQYKYLDHMDQRAEYRISAQAGLWRVSALRSYLRRHETVWEFESYGSRRAWRRPDSFFYVNSEYHSVFGKHIIPYRPTGVVHGRWVRPVVENLFEAHGIEVDYAKRGFYDRDSDDWRRKPRFVRALRRLRSIP